MVKFVGTQEIQKIVGRMGLENFFRELSNSLEEEFKRWDRFQKIPRVTFKVKEGVLELMPVTDEEYFSYKYVNSHEENPAINLPTIVATGAYIDAHTGMPLLLAEMTLLTALRTAATSAMTAKYLTREEGIEKFGIIGCGAQSEFQVIARHAIRKFDILYYQDIDKEAMAKFARNLQNRGFDLVPVENAEAMLDKGIAALTLCTTALEAPPLRTTNLPDGIFVDAMGGDATYKNELSLEALNAFDKIVIEYFPQTYVEGEIKLWPKEEAKKRVFAETWEIVQGKKPGRENNKEKILYDAVGYAIEDFAILKLIYELAKDDKSIPELQLLPDYKNGPKDLISAIQEPVYSSQKIREHATAHASQHAKDKGHIK